MNKIILAKTAGFCFGVNRAVEHIYGLVNNGGGNICTYGELIHNPVVTEDLYNKGVICISSLSEIPEGSTVVIRTHGVGADVIDYLDNNKIPYVNMTCPFVLRIQKIADRAGVENKAFIIAGNEEHPEVMGIRGHYRGKDFFTVKSAQDLIELDKNANLEHKNPILAAQTTFNKAEWKKICKEFANLHYTNAKIFDTICSATSERQAEAENIAKTVGSMIVIGGKESSNSQKLYEICKACCEDTVFIERAAELVNKNYYKFPIGITAGASTPKGTIEEVFKTMENQVENMEKELSFAEALEQSFKTIRRGEVITGTVMAVMSTEVQVDLGAKYTGILSSDEITGEPSSAELAKIYKLGDEIEVQVIKTNDVEGTALLSTKRIDAQKAWAVMTDAVENGQILAGKVAQVVKGGVVVNYESNRIFIPASQITSNKEADLTQLEGQTVQFKVIEVDKRRRRVIGSVKRAAAEMRKEAKERILAEIEVGKHYDGVVRSLTSYGAFVDIGGVDGMVHITELSWGKIKHPSEVVKVGDTVDVYVKEFEEETGRISLGYKDPNGNPMDVFKANYKVDDVVEVKIVKLMAYGAFAQIIPGVDGLVHISEIANERIEKVADKLKVGDTVSAKIIEIDEEKNRISLSIKALLTPVEEVAEEAQEEVQE